MSFCDTITTLWEFGPQKWPTSHCYLEPKMRIELTTYALRVRCEEILVEGDGVRAVCVCGCLAQKEGRRT